MLLLLTALASCHYSSPDLVYLPEHPTYQRDVYPLFSDHCLLCHSSPPNRGAPATFRLDVYEDRGDVLGAASYAGSALSDIESKRMPPAAKDGEGVGPKGIQMLKNWIADGKPKD